MAGCLPFTSTRSPARSPCLIDTCRLTASAAYQAQLRCDPVASPLPLLVPHVAARQTDSGPSPLPKDFFDEEGSEEQVSRQDAILTIGLGSWRLRPVMAPAFECLGAELEGAWRHLPLGSLQIEPLPEGFDFCDSMDPNHEQQGEVASQPGPKRGEKGWPRLQIENRCYSTRVFRKMHLELAHRQDDLQVLHCVMYPRQDHDVPILSIDMVGKGNSVSLGIIDPCPARMDRSIPAFFCDIVLQLQERYGLSSNRRTPEWGRDIFSDLCILVQPSGPEELAKFLKYAIALHQAFLTCFSSASSIQLDRQARMADIRAGHLRYCQQQLQNDRTCKVLESAFSSAFARQYMQHIMFDAGRAETS